MIYVEEVFEHVQPLELNVPQARANVIQPFG